jgi:hypothetical protein
LEISFTTANREPSTPIGNANRSARFSQLSHDRFPFSFSEATQ